MPNSEFEPNWFSRPGDTLLTLMEQRELTSDDVAKKIGCNVATIQGILLGSVAIDDNIAKGFSDIVGGTTRFWMERQRRYAISLANATDAVSALDGNEWVDQFPHADIAKYGWIPKSTDKKALLKTYLSYFGVSSPAEWSERYAGFLRQTAFRASPKFSSKVGPLTAWLRRGEVEASNIRCKSWDVDALRRAIPELRILTKSKNLNYFLPRVQSICAEAGVAVVFVRAPSGCSASGATRFILPEKAMVILSFRYLTEDHFWFTFFHEIAHLLLHNSSLTFIDGEEGISGKLEDEANNFSAATLIPHPKLDQLLDLRPNREGIIRFAVSVGVSPGIVVGQLQHHKVLEPNQMNHLKRKFDWNEITKVLTSSRGNE